MRVGLQTWGSEGDVRPFLALAGGLAARGHEVTLLVTDLNGVDYGAYARRLGFALRAVNDAHCPTGPDLEAVGRRLFASANPLRQLRWLMRDLLEPARASLFAAARELCATSDVVVGHSVLDPLRLAAQLHAVPWVSVAFAPMGIPSALQAPFGIPDLGRWANRLSWRLAQGLVNRSFLAGINAMRAQHGLAPDGDVLTQTWASPRLNLVAASPVLVQCAPDWGAQHRVCGFLNLAPAQVLEEPAPGLEEFLSRGDAPVYFTFGSMMPPNLDYIRAVAGVWSAAVHSVGCRAVFQLPWDRLEDIASTAQVFKVRRAPHRQVFPRCALIVHHGGAGTTQAAVLAGRPSVVIAHVIDQFYWARRLQLLGIAGPPLRRKDVTAPRLAAAIRGLLAVPGAVDRAGALAAAMAREEGVATAVQAIEASVAGRV